MKRRRVPAAGATPCRSDPYVQFVTDFADQAVILPLIAVVALFLACAATPKSAALWLFCAGATLGLAAVLKIGFSGCLFASPVAGLRSPSGHTASAVFVAGGLTVVLAGPPRRFPLAPLLAGLAAGAIIAATRVLLGYHTCVEVLAGALAGLGGLACLATLWRPAPLPRKAVLLALCAGTAIALHGVHLTAETWLRDTGCGTVETIAALVARLAGFPATP
jgi:membrane-associated phospholipid phosphatase